MSHSYRLIDQEAQLLEAVDDLEETLDESEEPRLYLDTEFESNRSGTKLCLLQISAGKTSYLIDPLKLRKLSSLRPLLSDPDVEWVLHAGLQDVDLICKHSKSSSLPLCSTLRSPGAS